MPSIGQYHIRLYAVTNCGYKEDEPPKRGFGWWVQENSTPEFAKAHGRAWLLFWPRSCARKQWFLAGSRATAFGFAPDPFAAKLAEPRPAAHCSRMQQRRSRFSVESVRL